MLSVTIALALCGCSSVFDLVTHPSADQATHLAPPYRGIVAEKIKDIVGPPDAGGVMQISGIRRVEYRRGPSWLVCLKVNSYSRPLSYAVFIQESSVIESRVAVMIDRCDEQTYDPFNWVAEAKAPAVVEAVRHR
jgi:hypothetical protein